MVVQERIRGGERCQCGAGGQADGGVRVRRRAVGPAPARPRRHHAARMDTAQIASQRSDHHDRLRERQHGGGGYQTGSFRLSRETGQPRNTARKNDRGGYTARTAPFTAGNAVRFGARNGYRMGTQRSVRQAPGSPVARRADQHVGSDHGRKRHGQGIRGPLHPRQQQAEGPSVRRRRLRRALARASCSDMPKEPLRRPFRTKRASSRRRKAEPFSSTRSATCLTTYRYNCSARFRNA